MTRARVVRGAALLGSVAVAALLASVFLAREIWIEKKIAALTSPPPRIFSTQAIEAPPKGDRPRVALLGDSSVSRWPMRQLSDRWEFINRGVGGETAAQLARRFEADAFELHPDVILILAGENDLVAASFLDEAAKRRVIENTIDTLLRLAETASRSGAQVLLGALVPPSTPELLRLPVWKESFRQSIAQVNATLRRSKLPERARFVDFAAALKSNDRQTPQEYRFDALHLNEEGYARLTETLHVALDSLDPSSMQTGGRISP